ncbi:MAG: UDP-N-acetylmuramyl-tripeptide synthetase [Pirellulales bacterium]
MDGVRRQRAAVSLRALLPEAEIVGADDIVVQHCSSDSRACRDGDLFAAFAGRRTDGHAYVPDAVSMGAASILASRPLPGCKVPVCYVPETRDAYGRICQALAGQPARQLKTIGVVGAFGKTTTGYLAASSLSAGGYSPGLLTSLGYCDGREISDARWTTPPAHVAAAWLARMVENNRTHAVLEISGRGLRDHRLAGVELDCLCVTNLPEVGHDDRDGGSCGTGKFRLLEQLAPEGVLVVNADDPATLELADRHSGPVITVGIDQPAEISATIVERHRSEQTLLLSFGREVIPLRTTLLGRHNVHNCLLAAAVGSVYGLAPAAIVRGLKEVRELPGRLERVECGQSFGVFVDEGRSPRSLAACLETLRATTSSRLICVISASPQYDRARRTRLAHCVRDWCDAAVVTSSPSEVDSDSLHDLAAGIQGLGGRCDVIADRSEAVRRALQAARPGDCVLIAGHGCREYRLEDREQDYWDDRQVVRQVLYSLQHTETEPASRRAA